MSSRIIWAIPRHGEQNEKNLNLLLENKKSVQFEISWSLPGLADTWRQWAWQVKCCDIDNKDDDIDLNINNVNSDKSSSQKLKKNKLSENEIVY